MAEQATKTTQPAASAPAGAELWRTSSLYPEIMVSNRGRVKERGYQSVVKDMEDGCFRIYEVPAKMIETRVGQSGAMIVNFYSKRRWVCEEVARLVAAEFVTNEDPDRYTRLKYRDGNRLNVAASNLYWDGPVAWSK